MTRISERELIEGRPVLVVIDIQGGAQAGTEPSAIQFMRATKQPWIGHPY